MDDDAPLYAAEPESGNGSMDHDAARALMAAAIEGTLSVEEERELAVHLVGCTDCKSLYSSLQQAELALRGLAFSHPPAAALDAAIARATTVLRGQADPGSGQTAVTPLPGEDFDIGSPAAGLPPPIPIPAPIFVEPEPVPFRETAEETTHPEDDELHTVKIFSRPETDEVPEPPAAEIPEPEPEPEPEPAPPIAERTETILDRPRPPEPEPEPVAAEPMLSAPKPSWLIEESTDDDVVLPPLPPRPGEPETVVSSPVDAGQAELFAAEPADVEAARSEPPLPEARRRPARAERPQRRAGAGLWLAAITVAVVIALIAGFVFTRTQSGGDAPSAAQVRARVQSRFAQLRSLKASFTIRRLDLYPVSRRGATMQYSFSDGTTTGRLVFDRAGGFREESTTAVGGNEVAATHVAQTVGEVRTLQGAGSAARLLVTKNPPFGPPDGAFYPSLGSLDRAIGSVAQMIVDANDLEVLGTRKTTDRDVIDIRFNVVPTELSRADKVDVSLDARTYVPVHVRREISRINGRVLAPESVLGGTALQTAFGNRDRILTEDTVLSDLVVDDVILPGDFVLDVPQGASTQNANASFQRVTRADLGSKLRFPPLFPQSLPEGFSEQALAVLAATPGTWGPNRSFPAPDGLMHGRYSDGKTTIVITQRHMPNGPFDLKGMSPITGGTLPIQVTPQNRAEKTFFYGSSPEVPPHAFGFLGNVFVLVTGYATADELVGMLASMAQAPGSATPPPVAATGTTGPTPLPTVTP